MSKFIPPKVEVVVLQIEDVITDSGNGVVELPEVEIGGSQD